MKVLFVDVDGVLNIRGDFSTLKRDAVENLKRVVELTEAELIVSSEWRRDLGKLRDLMLVLEESGMRVHDITPVHEGGVSCERRIAEIMDWLDHSHNITGWAVVDDLNLSSGENESAWKVSDNCVEVDPSVGLTTRDTNRLIDILNVLG